MNTIKIAVVGVLCGLTFVARAGFGDFLRKTAEVVVAADEVVNGTNKVEKVQVETPKAPEVKKITMDELKTKMTANEQLVLIDVRSEFEYGVAHLDGAINLPVRNFKKDAVAAIAPDKDKPVVVYCKSGSRASAAAVLLLSFGYTDVTNAGGIDDWKGTLVR